jgi:hypothetical protein
MRRGPNEIDRPLGRPDAADVIPQDCDAAAVSLLTQTLEDLLSAIRVAVQQPRDRPGGLRDRQALAITAVADLAERLIVGRWRSGQSRILQNVS